MKRFIYLFMTITLVLALGLSGCKKDDENGSDKSMEDPVDVVEDNEEDEKTSEDIINEFGEIIARGEDADDLVEFIDKNIKKVTSVEGDQMVIELIDRLEISKAEEMDKLHEFNESEFVDLFSEGYFSQDKVKDIENEELRDLVENLMENKYKLETEEGLFYPVVDYEKIKEYDDYVSDEVKDYIHLKAVDSNKKMASDGSLIISHDELANRTIEVEKYIEKYAGGAYHEEVKEMYKNKLDAYLSGLPNTPIYDYNTNKIHEDILKNYIETGNSGDTVTSFIVSKYVNVIRENRKIIDDAVKEEANSLVEEALTLLVSVK